MMADITAPDLNIADALIGCWSFQWHVNEGYVTALPIFHQ